MLKFGSTYKKSLTNFTHMEKTLDNLPKNIKITSNSIQSCLNYLFAKKKF